MSLRDVTLGQIILHVKTGLAFKVVAADTAAWQCVEVFGPNEGRPATVELHQLPEFRVIGRQG